ncbi:acetyl-CoA carboxylase carboxyl transferase subunit alpha [Saccharothrix variisporea]|uniref:Multifunctional fusion protein n=1 Tax=Saccharothrix variisporea TaxID=543527 RepID=A0A495XIH9_9PSEU|nr:acetyl-CoA carboxylase carboxyl transferase subunit beta [Saccharothrix variisporea]
MTVSTGPTEVQWARCPNCRTFVYLRRLRRHHQVCPDCSHHLRLALSERLDLLLDPGSLDRIDTTLAPVDVLSFHDRSPYPERLAAAQSRTGRNEAVVCGRATIGGHPVVVAALDFEFMGGSIGGVTGELVSRAARLSLSSRSPLLIVSASGGARMQEGAISLMQLAKTSQEIGRLREAGVLVVNLNTDPTYGGATASFSVLGDVVLAEPGARIGFAGPAVIKQTIRQELPPTFQTAEFLRDNGMLDLVVPRESTRATLTRLLALTAPATPTTAGSAGGHPTDGSADDGSVRGSVGDRSAGGSFGGGPAVGGSAVGGSANGDLTGGDSTGGGSIAAIGVGARPPAPGSIVPQGYDNPAAPPPGVILPDGTDSPSAAPLGEILPEGADTATVTDPGELEARPAAEVVRLARNVERPTSLDLAARVFEDFLELHGDRLSADDPAVVGGFARLGGRPVVFVGHQKGHRTDELVRRNFGMPQPAGYHKARRLMGLAERLRMPFVALVDTPGAFPGIEAEQRGQGNAIAECILTMSRMTVPTIAVVTGEGGSGGALAFAVGNRVLMLENAYFSVISPEGASTILFGDAAEAGRAAEALRLTAPELLRLGVVDGVVPEPPGGAHTDLDATAGALRRALLHSLAELSEVDDLCTHRYERFSEFGHPDRQRRL